MALSMFVCICAQYGLVACVHARGIYVRECALHSSTYAPRTWIRCLFKVPVQFRLSHARPNCARWQFREAPNVTGWPHGAPLPGIPYLFGMTVADRGLGAQLGFEGKVDFDDEPALRKAIFSALTQVRGRRARGVGCSRLLQVSVLVSLSAYDCATWAH